MVGESDILSANVLLVDDEEANVLLLRRTLSGAGYVSIASTMNPSEVAELHRKNRYDLIVLDLQMPGLNGLELCRRLRRSRDSAQLSIVMVTSAATTQRDEAIAAGCDVVLEKPCSPTLLVTTIQRLLVKRFPSTRTH